MILAVNWGHVLMVTLLGFLLVFCLLVVLIYILKLFGYLMQPRVTVQPSHDPHETVAHKHDEKEDTATLTGNATAAIAMALHLYYNGIHDEEPTKITIKQVERKYSPWNSKLYGMNNLNR
ncbi:MAG: OadG family protein [Paludibacteraceae bacterium]|nr:OadG family protein [Paludibacteraceae bacterium]MBR1786573.1 OadG family protein [Paludibacteraceae bacterium]